MSPLICFAIVECNHQSNSASASKISSNFQYSIQLVVHCGVNYKAKSIHLEKNAFNGNFCQADWDGKHLDQTDLCLPNSGECQQLCTELDLDKIVRSCTDKRIECSQDPGK